MGYTTKLKMAALSFTRCLRSLTRVSSNLGRNVVSSQGLSQVKSMSSLNARALLRADSNLLKSIARDSMVKSLAKRNARLSAAVCHMMKSCPALAVDCGSDGECVEGQGDDDETFSCDEEPIAVHKL